MPRGPNGEKRPRDTIGCAVHVMKIATGEVEEDLAKNREGGIKGGEARAKTLSPERRAEIARKAAAARWATSPLG